MDENGKILLLHENKNNARPLILPWLDDFKKWWCVLEICLEMSGNETSVEYYALSTTRFIDICGY